MILSYLITQYNMKNVTPAWILRTESTHHSELDHNCRSSGLARVWILQQINFIRSISLYI